MSILSRYSRKETILLMLLWTGVIFISGLINLHSARENQRLALVAGGRSFYNQIRTARRWNARSGGVYIPVSDRIQPNPYLEVPHRDITDTDGHKLTLINPAFMTRLVSEEARRDADNIQFHITSLNPINPKNVATAWEKVALEHFEKGTKEHYSFATNNGNIYFQYMGPLETKQACLKCHAQQGYKRGDIRGGIRVDIPITEPIRINSMLITHFLMWLSGIVFILVVGHKLGHRQEAIVEAKDKAEESARSKAAFLACMSHEIRTPMNGILAMSQLLADTELNSQQQEQVRTILMSGETLLAIINDILDFSKYESSELVLESKCVDLSALIPDVYHLLQDRADKGENKLSYSLKQDVPPFIYGDVTRLRQIVMNLVSNAVKFTHKGQISTSISVLSQTGDEYELQFSVCDTGIGISDDMQEQIFDTFTQADASTTRKYGGTGLGLAICRRLIESMGGKIWIESTKDVGSTFSFSLKAKRADPSAQNLAKSSNKSAKSIDSNNQPSSAQRPLKLLVVEDNAINVLVAQSVLTKLGYSADVRGNGREALEAVEENEYDLVFMDLQMPEMDGLDATRAIRALAEKGDSQRDRFAELTIVAMTADVMKENQTACTEAGMNDFISKPIDIEELRKVIQKWCD